MVGKAISSRLLDARKTLLAFVSFSVQSNFWVSRGRRLPRTAGLIRNASQDPERWARKAGFAPAVRNENTAAVINRHSWHEAGMPRFRRDRPRDGAAWSSGQRFPSKACASRHHARSRRTSPTACGCSMHDPDYKARTATDGVQLPIGAKPPTLDTES